MSSFGTRALVAEKALMRMVPTFAAPWLTNAYVNIHMSAAWRALDMVQACKVYNASGRATSVVAVGGLGNQVSTEQRRMTIQQEH